MITAGIWRAIACLKTCIRHRTECERLQLILRRPTPSFGFMPGYPVLMYVFKTLAEPTKSKLIIFNTKIRLCREENMDFVKPPTLNIAYQLLVDFLSIFSISCALSVRYTCGTIDCKLSMKQTYHMAGSPHLFSQLGCWKQVCHFLVIARQIASLKFSGEVENRLVTDML